MQGLVKLMNEQEAMDITAKTRPWDSSGSALALSTAFSSALAVIYLLPLSNARLFQPILPHQLHPPCD